MKYLLHRRVRQMLIVRAQGTACYVCEEGLDTKPARPKEFLNVDAAERAFREVAPEGWVPVVEPSPWELGIYGTGRIASEHEQAS